MCGTQCTNQAVTLNLSLKDKLLNLNKISDQMVKFEGSYDHQCLNLSITLIRKDEQWVLYSPGSLAMKKIVDFLINTIENKASKNLL